MFEPEVVNRIVTHMNEDHGDAIVLYLKAFAYVSSCESATMLSIDEAGMDIEYHEDGLKHQTRVRFDPQLESAGEARERLVAMVNHAREVLASS